MKPFAMAAVLIHNNAIQVHGVQHNGRQPVAAGFSQMGEEGGGGAGVVCGVWGGFTLRGLPASRLEMTRSRSSAIRKSPCNVRSCTCTLHQSDLPPELYLVIMVYSFGCPSQSPLGKAAAATKFWQVYMQRCVSVSHSLLEAAGRTWL